MYLHICEACLRINASMLAVENECSLGSDRWLRMSAYVYTLYRAIAVSLSVLQCDLKKCFVLEFTREQLHKPLNANCAHQM